MKPKAPLDPLEALRRLTPAEIETRIAELRAEDAALRTILRAMRARERTAKALAKNAIAASRQGQESRHG